ncbi:hypothetical protein H5410_005725 [Solanum commersonii]|uniref:Uncharacterized protein n=1 Tax=Solanum commersonii TaxID=4109 RepID=A0A9J6A896_SOLCO|nr:hypothetical protein H5410_005725 [Solanum commersonii]
MSGMNVDILSTLAALAIKLGMETTFTPFVDANIKSSLFNLNKDTFPTLASLAITLSMETTFDKFVDANGKSFLFNLALMQM